MGGTMRFAAVFALAFASLAACAATDLQPIRDSPVGPDAGTGLEAGTSEANPGEASATDAASVDVGPVDAGKVPCKRGIAMTTPPSVAFAPTAASPGVWWWYNWGSQGQSSDPRIEFVPMLWGGGSLTQAIPASAKYLLGFNEPNFKTQANLTAQQAAADWPMVEAKATAAGLPIVSPGVNFCGSASDSSQCSDPAVTDPYTYLKDFFAACSGCKVDYIGVHAYYCDVQSLRAYLEGNTASGGTLEGFVQFGKPIWLTEFACDKSRSVAEQKAFMQAAVPYLEGNANVMRYAWFSAKPIPNAVLTNSDGSLTDLGATYVALPQSCH
jgi:hypothetical protein